MSTTKMNIVKISKFLSKCLRHEPELLGLTLESGGWVLVSDLLTGANKKGQSISHQELEQVVANNDKKRFSFNYDKTKIRANQGHSTEVDLQLKEAVPPDVLFHGTIVTFLSNIIRDGLKKMSRHAVHLSKDVETAINVGSRRGKPIVLTVDALKMAKDGFKFYVSDNGVWLTESVPSQYINIVT